MLPSTIAKSQIWHSDVKPHVSGNESRAATSSSTPISCSDDTQQISRENVEPNALEMTRVKGIEVTRSVRVDSAPRRSDELAVSDTMSYKIHQ